MEFDDILSKLEAAENTVSMLRQFVEEQRTKNARNSNDSGSSNGEPPNEPQSLTVPQKKEMNFKKYEQDAPPSLRRGEEVFRLPGHVALYVIVPGDPVRRAAKSAILRIVRLSEEEEICHHPPCPRAFIQVGDWVYPLMRGSMAYRSEQNYYLFPDLDSTTPGSSIGVVLPKTCDPQHRVQFEMLLLGFLNMPEFPPQSQNPFSRSTKLILADRTSVSLVRTASGVVSLRQINSASHIGGDGSRRNKSGSGAHKSNGGGGENHSSYGKRIGTGFKAGGKLLSLGFELGAKGTASVVNTGALCLMTLLNREEHCKEVAPGLVVHGIAYAREVTGRVVNLSSAVVETLRVLASKLASLTMSWIRSTLGPVVQRCIDITGVKEETVDEVATEVKNIGEGFVVGVSEAYAGLETAAKILTDTLNDNTVQIVSHCYGPCAATMLGGAKKSSKNGASTGNIVQSKVTLAAKKAELALSFEQRPDSKTL